MSCNFNLCFWNYFVFSKDTNQQSFGILSIGVSINFTILSIGVSINFTISHIECQLNNNRITAMKIHKSHINININIFLQQEKYFRIFFANLNIAYCFSYQKIFPGEFSERWASLRPAEADFNVFCSALARRRILSWYFIRIDFWKRAIDVFSWKNPCRILYRITTNDNRK